ncbi:MAG: hypothetical protein IJT36_02560 [Alphaproteobacteria bacterium]|nr:hypothetical protein [Alphaproteobacteria bacterium]
MKKFFIRIFLLLLLSFYFETQGAGLFVSLKSSEVNMRVGPGKEYPVSWVFMRANLPMQLMAEFDQWRKVRFIDGTVGWVHKNMISRKSSAIVTNEYAIMYRHASKTHPIAKIEKGVILRVIKRDGDFVKVDINNQKGWVEKGCLWGMNED